VPLDGSALAETVLEPAIDLLKTWANVPAGIGGELHLLHVVDDGVGEPPAYGKFGSQAFVADGLLEEVRHQAETYVNTVADRLRAGPLAQSQVIVTSGVSIKTDVAGTIVKLAEQAETAKQTAGYDLIAMATHGRGGVEHFVMGSVTERVLHATKLPLLVVRPAKARVSPAVSSVEAGRQGVIVTETTAMSWVGLL
jgi:nucleotide-binding universal stress UspA family protein